MTPPPFELVRPTISLNRTGWGFCDRSEGCELLSTVRLSNTNYRTATVRSQVRLSREGERGWPLTAGREGAGAHVAYTWPQGRWYVQARYQEAGQEAWSPWSRTLRVTAEPTSSELQNYGSRPGAPERVIIKEHGSGPNARWKISWDAPSDIGGWLIKRWRYADTGPSRFNGRIPGRSCGDSHWPDLEYHVDNPPSGAGPADEGREFGVTVPLGVRPGWTISISAVNAEGEGMCAEAERRP